MAAVTVLPYRIRYASGRDTCIKCGTQIPKGQIQLAIVEQVCEFSVLSCCEIRKLDPSLIQIDAHLILF